MWFDVGGGTKHCDFAIPIPGVGEAVGEGEFLTCASAGGAHSSVRFRIINPKRNRDIGIEKECGFVP
jgi:hypothetical protein